MPTSILSSETYALVTGAAGFIGYHTCRELLDRGVRVFGIDNLNHYYDPSLKRHRLNILREHSQFRFEQVDIADAAALINACDAREISHVVHLAAQAGVRYSLDNPTAYVQSNLVGFANILELCRELATEHLVYASSSSVYGGNTGTPFSLSDSVDRPLNLYAATKKSNELMAHSYSHLYGLPATGVRFFTVYGPWGRPDMAIFKFANKIMQGCPIDVYNSGNLRRDFTYIDDAVEGLLRILSLPPGASEVRPSDGEHTASGPCRIYNLGNSNPVELQRLIALLEENLGRRATQNHMAHQPGDMIETAAEMSAMLADFDFAPTVSIESGIASFCEWFRAWDSSHD